VPYWLPVAASSFASEIDGLILFITVVVGVWFLAAEAVLFYLIFKYRRRQGRRAEYVAGTSRVQMAWVLVPCAAILCFDLVIDSASTRVWDLAKLTAPPADLTVRVQGRQWAWIMTHPGPDGLLDTADDIVTPNDLHIPALATVSFELISMDTLHSLWIPELRLKQDAVPGRTFRGWVQATRPGQYPVLCAELCGVAHGLMKGMLFVDGPAEYQKWLADQTQAKESKGS
jgi:cytochrome c oxidase subunit 2